MTTFPYKAAFFDLDGTLALDGQPPAPEDTTAIRRFRAAGGKVFLCTGRSPGMVYPSILDIGFDGVVAGAGSYVALGERLLYRRTVAPEQVRRLIALCRQNGCFCNLEGDGGAYFIHPEHLPPTDTPEALDPLYAGDAIYKFVLYGVPPPAMRDWLRHYFTLTECPYGWEIVPIGCDKATGIRCVLDAVGLRPEEAIGIGDSANDLDMLRCVGFGVAMGGAPEEVRAAADWVTGTMAEHGVAQALAYLEQQGRA